MSWGVPAGGDDWGSGGAVATNGGGGGDWDTPAVGSSEKYGGDAFNDGAEAENDYGYGGGEETGDGGGGFSGACFNCGQEGHSKAECPEPPKARPCFNCSEEGHTKAECTNPAVPREFSGTCRICEQQGHRASDCPSAPPKLCNNCKEEGHSILECKNPRKIERNDVEDVAAEVAWENLIKQSQEGDFDDMKDEVMKYIKASPDATYVQLEKAFRSQNIPIYLIATEKELTQTFTNMDLQGNLDRKYTISWRKSSKHSRPKEKENWPATPEENLERLADAGEPVDRGVPLCSRCSELGHISKHCTQEVGESERVQVQCFNCSEIGHRVRDCPIPREDKFACRNCKKSGHSSKDCTGPRSAEGVECKKCNEIGHFSRDCPTGGGGDGGVCRNCNQPGHHCKWHIYQTLLGILIFGLQPRNVPMSELSSVATVMQRVIPARSAQSLVTILVFNARTASRWVTPRFVAKSQLSKTTPAMAKWRLMLVIMVTVLQLTMSTLLSLLPTMIAGVVAVAKRLHPVVVGRTRVCPTFSRNATGLSPKHRCGEISYRSSYEGGFKGSVIYARQ